MRLIHPRDKSLHDFVNIQPIRHFDNPLDEQNDMTLGLKTKNYRLFISSPGYHQTTLIPLVSFDLLNSYCDFHYESTEKKKDMIISPKFGNFPIQLLIYPLQEMNFKFLHNSVYDASNETLKKMTNEIKINSFKKRIKLSPALFFASELINLTISGWMSVTYSNPQILYKLSWTVGMNSLYFGSSLLKDKNDDDIYEFAARYNENNLDFRFWISQSTNTKNFSIKNSVEYISLPYTLFLSSKFNSLNDFKFSSKISDLNKSLELGFNSSKKLKCFLGAQLKDGIYARVGMTTNSFVGLEDPPLFKVCVVFDKSAE